MGGALKMKGNVSPFAEFNIWVDPEAARIVFDSSVKKVLVPLDVTTTVDVSMEEMRAAVGSGSDFAKYLVRATEGWVEAMKVLSGRAAFNPHDPIAMAWLLEPALFETAQMQVLVEERTGRTTGLDAESGSTTACLRVDVPRFKKIFFESLRRIAGQSAK